MLEAEAGGTERVEFDRTKTSQNTLKRGLDKLTGVPVALRDGLAAAKAHEATIELAGSTIVARRAAWPTRRRRLRVVVNWLSVNGSVT